MVSAHVLTLITCRMAKRAETKWQCATCGSCPNHDNGTLMKISFQRSVEPKSCMDRSLMKRMPTGRRNRDEAAETPPAAYFVTHSNRSNTFRPTFSNLHLPDAVDGISHEMRDAMKQCGVGWRSELVAKRDTLAHAIGHLVKRSVPRNTMCGTTSGRAPTANVALADREHQRQDLNNGPREHAQKSYQTQWDTLTKDHTSR